MKIGIIAQRLCPSLAESLEIAARLGVDGVQLYSATPVENLLDFTSAERREIVTRCRCLGLEIFSVCGEVGGFGFRLREKNPERVERSKRNLDLALELGCRIVTSHIGAVRPEAEDPLRLAQLDALAEIGDYAESCGAAFAVETGPETGSRLRDFLEQLNVPGIKVNLDPGNMVMVTGENPAETVRELGPYIVHTHVKDGVRFQSCDPEKVYAAFASGGIRRLIAETGELFCEAEPGSGNVCWEEYRNALLSIGFDGALVIEQERSENSQQKALSTVKFIRNLIHVSE